MEEATHVAMMAEALRTRSLAARESIGRQWRPVIMPALALWLLATIVSCGFLHPFDVTEYATYAHAALRAPLFHRFPLEYPAPALAVFLLPLLLPFSYPWAFAVVAGIVLVFLVTSYEGSGVPGMDMEAARRLIVYLAVGAVILVTGRYDIFAVAAAFWSVRAARQDRWSAAWTWSCIGFVIKLFPAIFWPALLIAEWRRSGRLPVRRLAWMAVSAVVLVGVPALFNHEAVLNVLHYYQHRPTETGSLPAGLSLLIDWHGSTLVTSFHSINIVNAAAGPVGVVVELVAAVGCLGIWWAQFRGRLPLEAACLASLTVALLGSKVLSAQYVVWLMPLWALYRFRSEWLLAALANVVVFPYEVSSQSFGLIPTHAFDAGLTLAYLARDLLIAWGTWRWLRSELVDGASSPSPLAPSP
ncbi:MAG TPA: glycosyltransferase 87 family protein [Acidimicrobiales bacterium]|nr:glycosyltransferase 87 family protein [Acidimicrobiales bacterium]